MSTQKHWQHLKKGIEFARIVLGASRAEQPSHSKAGRWNKQSQGDKKINKSRLKEAYSSPYLWEQECTLEPV